MDEFSFYLGGDPISHRLLQLHEFTAKKPIVSKLGQAHSQFCWG